MPVTAPQLKVSVVGIIDDTLVENLVEGTEQFRIDISAVNPVEAIAASAFNLGDTATVSITDNDTTTITIADVSAAEGDGPNNVTVTISLSNPVEGGLTATIATSSGNSALSGSDFSALSQVISFADSSTASSSVQLTVLGDAIIEADETLQLFVASVAAAEASNSQILRQTGTFSIVNDDFAAITIDDVSGSESGTISIGLSVNLAVAGGFTLTVQSDSGSAVEGVDFSSVDSQQVAFAGSANETQTLVLTGY